MKAFVDWVAARRYRLILMAIVFAPLLPVVAAALLSVETVRRGLAQGLLSAALGIGGMLVLGWVSGANVGIFAIVAGVCFLSGVAIGALLQKTVTLGLAFQTTMLFALLAVAAISAFSGGARELFAPMMAEVVEALRASNATPAQIAMVESRGPMVLLVGVVFSHLVGAVLLAYWWVGLAAGERRFGEEFRKLKLGRVLGILATSLVALGLVFDAALVQNLSALALLGFMLQGLAVLHAWAHARQWHAGFIAPVYVLFVTPLMVLVLLSLSTVGFVDHWFNLRARLSSQA